MTGVEVVKEIVNIEKLLTKICNTEGFLYSGYCLEKYSREKIEERYLNLLNEKFYFYCETIVNSSFYDNETVRLYFRIENSNYFFKFVASENII